MQINITAGRVGNNNGSEANAATPTIYLSAPYREVINRRCTTHNCTEGVPSRIVINTRFIGDLAMHVESGTLRDGNGQKLLKRDLEEEQKCYQNRSFRNKFQMKRKYLNMINEIASVRKFFWDLNCT